MVESMTGNDAAESSTPRRERRWWLVGWLIALAAVIAFAGAAVGAARALPSDARLDEPAPPFEVLRFPGTIQVVPGRTLALQQVAGRPVVVHFWASWCEVCHAEADLQEQLWREYRERGVVFIGVAVHDTEHTAQVFARRAPMTFPTGLDVRGDIGADYRLFGVPETVFIDRSGRIVRRHAGPLTEPTARAYLDELLR
jgi:cytochrome c biogenesis protein CcmG/thiol:disulfide interchange protein DsbE